MNIYIVRYGDNVLEYKKIIDSDSLSDINSKISVFNFDCDQTYPKLGGIDIELLRRFGGTVFYKENNSCIIHCLIDLDFNDLDINTQDEWQAKINNIRKSIKRDMNISILTN